MGLAEVNAALQKIAAAGGQTFSVVAGGGLSDKSYSGDMLGWVHGSSDINSENTLDSGEVQQRLTNYFNSVTQPAPGVGSGGTGGHNATGYVAPSVTVVQQPAGGSGVTPAPSPATGGGSGSGQVLDVFGFLSGDGGAILTFGIVAVIGYKLLALLFGRG